MLATHALPHACPLCHAWPFAMHAPLCHTCTPFAMHAPLHHACLPFTMHVPLYHTHPLLACTPLHHACPPSVNRITDRCKNITFPQLHFVGGKYLYYNLQHAYPVPVTVLVPASCSVIEPLLLQCCHPCE